MKKLGGIGLLLLLAAGVWVNSLRPAPNAEAREAIGQEMVMVTSCEGNPCDSLLTVISYENPIRIHTSENYIGP